MMHSQTTEIPIDLHCEARSNVSFFSKVIETYCSKFLQSVNLFFSEAVQIYWGSCRVLIIVDKIWNGLKLTHVLLTARHSIHSLQFFLNSLNSVTKNICHLKGSNLPSLALEIRMLPQHQQDTCGRQNL